MNNTLTIMKKELKGYFYSPLAYVIGVLLLGLAGYFYYLWSIAGGFAGIHPMISILSTALLFTAPLMSMKLIAEEKKRGTIELLLTMPVKPGQIILGKFFAVALIFLIIVSITLIHTLVLAIIGNPEAGVTFSLYLGLILEGLALLSIGLFISSLTDSQVVAGISSLGVGLAFFFINLLSSKVGAPWNAIFGELSFGKHLGPFFQGLIDLKDIAFFVLITLLGLGLSTQYLENEKWRK
jgi:ABC-2 type transport system permease protein